MQVILKTEVPGTVETVMNAFDRSLFEALKPKAAKMEIVRFTGSKKGDIVHLRFVRPFKAEWISHIVEDNMTTNRAYFVDKGVQIPFPLKTWEHHHIVEKKSENAVWIIDDMRFTGRNALWSMFLYPMIYFGFLPRKKIYKSYFTKIV